jgi:hypothetical protein
MVKSSCCKDWDEFLPVRSVEEGAGVDAKRAVLG